MVRHWLTRCLLAAGTLLALPAWPLGLGEITVHSALNEPFSAEIEVLDTSGLSPGEIVTSLASAEDFERVGVERFFFLTSLRFEVTYGEGGAAVIRVTSTQPITEPYLDILVEVLWPSGRLLKEFTVLLDPPTFADAAPPPAVRAPATQAPTAQSPSVASGPSGESGTRVRLDPPAAPRAERRTLPAGEQEYPMTGRDDTLWSIALETRPSDRVSVQQNMLAIQRLNPGAFIKDNINLLKAGYVLRLPDEAAALKLSESQAQAEVQLQTDDWLAMVRGETPNRRPTQQVADTGLGGQLDATPKAGPDSSSPPSGDGQLSIVAGTDGETVTGSSAGTGDARVAAALEENDRLAREVDELTYQLDRQNELVANQLAVRDRQLEVKDQQIAQLQEQLDQVREDMKTIAARQQSQNQNAPPAEPEAWWTLPAVWAMGAVILILTLVLMMVVARQRREKQAEIDAFLSEDAAPAASAESAVAFASDELDIEAEDDEDDDLMRAGLDASDGEVDADSDGDWPADEEDDAGVAPATGDVLAEADIYIAYERFPQAVSLLKGALDKDPDRDDARLKLLEVHAETGDQSAFETQLAELEQRCDDSEILLAARELQSRFESDAPVSLDDLDDVPDVAASTDRTTSADGPDVEETDGDMLDDFELTLDDDGETSGLDFELELDGGDTDETEESVATRADADEDDGAGAGDQLGGDLGMDFDPDRDVSDTGAVTPAAVATTLEVDDDLDLLTDESDDEFDFFDDADAATTKLDLARAYIDMGDSDGARDILQEVIGEGSSEQQKQARDLLGQI